MRASNQYGFENLLIGDNARLPSPPTRVFVAKIMYLSVIWYHAGLATEWDEVLETLDDDDDDDDLWFMPGMWAPRQTRWS